MIHLSSWDRGLILLALSITALALLCASPLWRKRKRPMATSYDWRTDMQWRWFR